MQNSWMNISDKADRYNQEINSDHLKKIISYNKPFISPANISSINRPNVQEIDNFYNIVQLHREQYKNSDNKSHPMKYFKQNDHDGMTHSYFTNYPVTYVKYKTPLILPSTYSRSIQLPHLPDRKNPAIYHRSNCIAFKR